MTPAQLRGAITPKSRLLMLNSPSNPTGAVYTRQELEALADVVLDKRLAVLSDEIYEKLIYGDSQGDLFRRRCGPACGADHHRQRREQDLCDDRLAHGLGAGAGGHVIKAMGERAEPADEQPVQHQPVRGPGGPGGRAGVRGEDAARV